MSVRKWLLKLNNKFEQRWERVNHETSSTAIADGWYIVEFVLDSQAQRTPRLVIRSTGNPKDEELIERLLVGAHAGRNRMLIYLPVGKLVGFSASMDIQRIARLSIMEARARILLICTRYLIDFFSARTFGKMLYMQFQESVTLSDKVLAFYAPKEAYYLDRLNALEKYRYFARWLGVLSGQTQIAILIEDESQRGDLAEQLVAPNQIVTVSQLDQLSPEIEYVLPLRKTEQLRSAAVYVVKRAIQQQKKRPVLVYTDHDYIDVDEELIQLPVLKPQPSCAYLHCFNYIGFAVIVRRAALQDEALPGLFDGDFVYQKALEWLSADCPVLHVSESIFQSLRPTPETTPGPFSKQSPWKNIVWSRRDDHNVLLAADDWLKNTDSELPAIDLVIPTRDGLSVLKPCIESILSKTEYPNYKIIVVDNGSERPETHNYLRAIQTDPKVDVVTYPGEFNYSAINNFAVGHGGAPYIGLINNDIEVIKGDWLTHMMAWALQPDVGVVGAKLLFTDRRVQHAGVIIGMGNAAGHIHRLEAENAPGYQLRCLATQNMMAVTAACFVTPRSVFESLKGLDDEYFKVAYNDIDYCLKVEAQGLQVIWTPEAKLLHHESVSRGDDMSDKHVDRYFRELKTLQSRWNTKGFVDKYYSPHLRISDEGVYPQIERDHEDAITWLDASEPSSSV